MIKAVVFDMDGTLLCCNSWQELHFAYGLDDVEDQALLKWYKEGVIDYIEWTDLISRIYRARGKATRNNAEMAFERCQLDPAAAPVVREIQRLGLKTMLLSGGIEELVSTIASNLEIERFAGNHTMKFTPEGAFERFDIFGDDRLFKIEKLKDFCHEYSIEPTECLCIGDGCNEAGIFELTGRGVLLCPQDRKPPVINYWKRFDFLTDVISYIPELIRL